VLHGLTGLGEHPVRGWPHAIMLSVLLSCLCGWLLAAPPAVALDADVPTQHNDPACTGAQVHETLLQPSNVRPATFGRLYERHVDGQIIAQPLYLTNLAIPNKGLRNMPLTQTTPTRTRRTG